MLAPSQACRLTRFNVRLWGPLHGARHPPPRLHCEHGDARPTVWPGLEPWRQSGVNELRGWGRKGPQSVPITPGTPAPECRWRCLADAAVAVLQTPDPAQKAALTHAAWHAVSNGSLPVGGEPAAAPPPFPARPPRPQLVAPKQVPTAKASRLPLPAYMLHSLAHVELNAVDLAWDTVARFAAAPLPRAFFLDFARVADDESRHLLWCLQRLGELGHAYGDMPAHSVLWEGAQASAGDVGSRLAVVPMSQEARGLDAGPRLVDRLVGLGDARSAAIVRRIAQEETAHVAVGVVWFRGVCAALGADPGHAFRATICTLCPDVLRGPFEAGARAQVGLPPEWYDPGCWPEGERERLAEALRARKEGALDGRTAAEVQGGGRGDTARGPQTALFSSTLQDAENLGALRARLEHFVAGETARAAPASAA
uniref:DUF455 domain-containing protein n=1 Tax=Auxenochlorella protothecoides TaxID=3075 RepID=A0A1D2A0V9_AUXPR